MRARSFLALFSAALLSACSLSLDFYDGIPCTTGADCLHDYRCYLGTSCVAPTGMCGDQVVDSGEECDDGNDADGDQCTSACVRVACDDGGFLGDGDNCGTCGHGCDGGACTDGRCEPVLLIAQTHDPYAVFTTADDVFFCDYGFDSGGGDGEGGVWRIPKSGGNPVEVVGNKERVLRMVTDGTDILFLEASSGAFLGQIWRVPLIGGTATTVATPARTSALAIGGGFAYFGDEPSGGTSVLRRKSLTTTDPAETILNASVADIALNDEAIFWITYDGDVSRATLANGYTIPISTGEIGVSNIIVDATHVYWITTGSFESGYDGHISRANLDGTGAEELGDIYGGYALAVDDVWLYATAFYTTVRLPKAGGPQEQLCTQAGEYIHVDGRHLYFGDGISGQLYRLTLPAE